MRMTTEHRQQFLGWINAQGGFTSAQYAAWQSDEYGVARSMGWVPPGEVAGTVAPPAPTPSNPTPQVEFTPVSFSTPAPAPAGAAAAAPAAAPAPAPKPKSLFEMMQEFARDWSNYFIKAGATITTQQELIDWQNAVKNKMVELGMWGTALEDFYSKSVAQMQVDIVTLRDKIRADVTAQNQNLRTELDRLQTELTAQSQRATNSANTVEEMKRQIKAMMQEKQTLESKIGYLSAELIKGNDRYIAFQQVLNQAQGSLTTATQAVGVGNAEIERLKARLEEATQYSNTTITAKQNQIDAMRKEIEDYQARLKNIDPDLSKKLEEAKAILIGTENKYTAQIQNLNGAIIQLTTQYSGALVEAKLQAEKVEATIKQSNQIIEQLKAKHTAEITAIQQGLIAQHQRTVDDLTAQHARALEQVKIDAQKAVDDFKSQMNAGQTEEKNSPNKWLAAAAVLAGVILQ